MNASLKITLSILFFSLFFLAACKSTKSKPMNNTTNQENLNKAYFAGGCFWCSENHFSKYEGVIEVTSGYLGGTVEKPTYEQVSAGTTGHYEAVEVLYDPAIISFSELVEHFWTHIDPTDAQGQFADKGSQYKAAIFYSTDEEKQIAEASKEKLASSGKFKETIATEVKPASEFYAAEDYHQDYAKKNPVHYKMYSFGSGREQFIKDKWHK
jgi:methionine-S-sulfoxide reductase